MCEIIICRLEGKQRYPVSFLKLFSLYRWTAFMYNVFSSLIKHTKHHHYILTTPLDSNALILIRQKDTGWLL